MDARGIVARNVRRIRVRQGLSQEALAADAQIGRAYISALERGQKNATILLLDRIASVLGVPIGSLFTAPKAGERAPDVLPKGRKARGR
jgi:transcriptional regulator with XRE-family HTH domain